MDVYRSLAAILTSSVSSASLPISLIASQLSSASNEQKPELARVLAELLRVQSTPDIAAQKALHDYVRSLLLMVDLSDTTKHFRLVVDLADSGSLMEILEETVVSMDRLLARARNAHISSDEAFAVDFQGSFEGQMAGIKEVEVEGKDQKILHDTVIRYLRFWHFLFLLEGGQPLHTDLFQRLAQVLPVRLLAAMALRDQDISQSASNALCLFVSEFHGFLPPQASEMLWDGIGRLMVAEVHVDLALALWLRWIAASSENVRPIQEVLGSDKYWSLIQKCLATGFSERRKYSLHLLTTSISLVQQPVSTRTFAFDPKKAKPIAAAWSKYTTLIEIVSLSTSPNQLRDATPDLKRLLDPSSHIPASWLVVLITLGFQSSSSGVARAFWDIVTSLEKRRLARLFDGPEGRTLLQDMLLPYAAYASNFNIVRSAPEKCGHGVQLGKWVGSILGAGDVQMKKSVARAILQWVDEKEDSLFAPARAYILRGLLEGVQGQKIFDRLGDLTVLVKVAKMQRATKLKSDVCVAIVQRLLLSVDVEAVGFAGFWSAMAEMALKKEYLLSQEYISAVDEHCGPSLRVAEQLRTVNELVFGEDGSPTKIELLKAVLIVYLISCRDSSGLRDLTDWIKSFQEKLKIKKSRLSFWAVLQGNRQLFDCVQRLFDRQTILSSILQNYLAPGKHDADLTVLVKAWPANAVSVGALPLIFRSRWARLQETQGQKFQKSAGQERAQWAMICASTLRQLQNTFEFLSVDDIVGAINAFDLPTLGPNKHDNTEMTATAGSFIEAMLSLLNHCIVASNDEISAQTVSRILTSLPRLMRFLESKSLLRTLDLIRNIASKLPQQLLDCQRLQNANLSELILQLWETVDAATLRLDFAKVYYGFIETIFHPVILSQAVDNEELRETLSTVATKIMNTGRGKRSIRPSMARCIRNAFLHTPEHPRIIGRSHWLIDIIIELITYQHNDNDKDMSVEHPLTVLFDEVAPCADPGMDRYYEYYGDREIFAQVYMFDMLARMDENDQMQAEFVGILRETMFLPWTENYSGMSIWVAWKKHTHLQTLVLLERFVRADEAGGFLDRAIDTALYHEPHPRFRFLFEWIVSLCILRFPSLRNRIWNDHGYLQNPKDQNPKLQVSLLRVALMVSWGLPEPLREEYFTELAHTTIPLTSNTKVVVRHQAIAMTLELWEFATTCNYTSLTSNPLLARIHTAVINSAYYKEFRDARDFRTFDAVENYTLAGIFAGVYLTGGDEIEVIPQHSFPPDELEDTQRSRRLPLGSLPSRKAGEVQQPLLGLHAAAAGRVTYYPQDAAKLAALSSTSTAPAPLQTKGPSTAGAADDSDNDIIVCASLLDNAFNLGGVSRVSEIMGVHTLTLSSLATTKTGDFSSVSVHSESWLDLQEVPIPGIAGFLREKRAEGYTAVGIEQTDRSVVLGRGECVFPKKTVLLLGTEKFGIPAELLAELDWCVEIPQRGRTRSMNVQTAAAVVLYEACRQRE